MTFRDLLRTKMACFLVEEGVVEQWVEAVFWALAEREAVFLALSEHEA